MATRFRWTADNLTVNTRNVGPRIERAIREAVDYQATRSETYMRTHARWTDRTTNARNGLRTITSHTPGPHSRHTIILTHSMHYGIWLEVRWSGKYGILPESIRGGGQDLMRLFGKMFGRL